MILREFPVTLAYTFHLVYFFYHSLTLLDLIMEILINEYLMGRLPLDAQLSFERLLHSDPVLSRKVIKRKVLLLSKDQANWGRLKRKFQKELNQRFKVLPKKPLEDEKRESHTDEMDSLPPWIPYGTS